MSYDKLPDYIAYRSIIKRLLCIVGLWPNEDPSVFYWLRPYPFLFVNLCVTLGMSLYVKMHSTNVAAITKALSVMSSFLTIILKMLCVMVNREELHELHIILDHHFSKLLKSQPISTTVLSDLRTFRRISWVFLFFVTIVNTFTAATPIISIIYQHLHSVDPIAYPYVYPTAYPWYIEPPGFRYKLHFTIELAAIVPYFCVSPSIDSLFMMYGFQMMGQFREMSHRILNIDEMDDDRIAVKQCVQQHQLMLRSRDILQKIFGPILLWVITTNAIALCSVIFQLTQMKSMSISATILFAAYVWLKILQTFMYAYAGTSLTSESEKYQAAIYNANWHSNRRFMTSILIMLAQKPIILNACNFSVVSLVVFVKFLNTSISYFFLLQTVS